MGFTTVSDLYFQVLMRVGGDKYSSFIKLYRAWKDIVGELLAGRSHPYRFRDHVLFIAVQNNSWLQELILHKTEILQRCRMQTEEEIRDIIFMIRG